VDEAPSSGYWVEKGDEVLIAYVVASEESHNRGFLSDVARQSMIMTTEVLPIADDSSTPFGTIQSY
jgi:hypothetical protein